MKFRTTVPTASLALALLFGPSAARAQYQVTNLVSNQEGVAKVTDPLLANAWGLVHGPGAPYWISDNTSGWSTLYTGALELRNPWTCLFPPPARTVPVRPRASSSTHRRSF